MALNMLWSVRREIGQNSFLPLIFVRWHFQEIGIAALLLGLKPRRVEKVRECQLTDVGEGKLKIKKKKHVQNTDQVRRMGDLTMVN